MTNSSSLVRQDPGPFLSPKKKTKGKERSQVSSHLQLDQEPRGNNQYWEGEGLEFVGDFGW